MKSVQFSSLIKQYKRSKFKVTTTVLRNRLNIAKKYYGLSKIYTYFKRVERLAFTVINYIRELIAQKLHDNGIHSITGSILYMYSIGITADDAYFVSEIHTLQDLSV